jgi:Vacuole effluxer Atg22 like
LLFFFLQAQRVLFCTLIPKGQETEMMGLFTFTGQILGWLPPLIVTILNENGVELRYGLLVIVFFCMFAVVCTLPMGSYKDAAERVALDSEEKYQSVLAATKAISNDPRPSARFDTGIRIIDPASEAESEAETGENPEPAEA